MIEGLRLVMHEQGSALGGRARSWIDPTTVLYIEETAAPSSFNFDSGLWRIHQAQSLLQST